MKEPSARSVTLRISLLSFVALLVHGYHLGVDDAEIYVPAIKRAADPGLYPFGSEFFMSHAGLSLFPDLVGGLARWTHLPVNFVIFSCHVVCIFLLLLASWKLLRACFEDERACWGGVALLAAVLSVPAAGTALVIMDPYVTARSLSTPATIFILAAWLSNQRMQALGWLILTALIHPQMSAYAAAFLACFWLVTHLRSLEALVPAESSLLQMVPFGLDLRPAAGAAREALLSRSYFFVSNWTWYEWLGVFAPLAIASWWSVRPPKSATGRFRPLVMALPPFGLLFTAAAVVLSSSPRLENFARLQPMRAFHLVYVVFFLMLGGWLGERVLQNRPWRWLALFIPLAAGMYALQQHQFPNSPHVEWPGYDCRNNWNAAFSWVRLHTPKNAVFALDPQYMLAAGDDEHGFRAVAERSALADAVKDSGAVSLFPRLAGDWKSQVQAQDGWEYFTRKDFERLAAQYPVTWIITRNPAPAGLPCPYRNAELTVCQVEAQSATGAAGSTTN